MITILFFMNNLRLNDNRALNHALSFNDPILPIVVDDLDRHQIEWFGWASMGEFRRTFWIESILDLGQSLNQIGSKLCCFQKHPLDALIEIHSTCKELRVVMPHVLGSYEAKQINLVKDYCKSNNIEFDCIWDWTLIDHIDLNKLSLGFSSFRKKVEKNMHVSEPSPPPTSIPNHTNDFRCVSDVYNKKQLSTNGFQTGGETSATDHLNEYVWESKAIGHYKKTRNKLIGNHFSSKLSTYLSHGCLSPRRIYHEIRKFESKVSKNESTYWLIFELLWRDFFQFQYLKHHSSWFDFGGIQQKKWKAPKLDTDKCMAWATGTTQNDFINANMLELIHTGYMSNRGRQNVASYLIHDLGQDWRYGAAVFEHYLIDYDVASNIGNWMYIAGVGNSVQMRIFNVVEQQKRYDASLRFTNHWLLNAR